MSGAHKCDADAMCAQCLVAHIEQRVPVMAILEALYEEPVANSRRVDHLEMETDAQYRARILARSKT